MSDSQASSIYPLDIAYIKIYPPIGIARLGDSGFDLDGGVPDGLPETFFPSEIPGNLDPPVKFRDSKNRIKRQAVQFRVYAYDVKGKILGQITSGNDYDITWKVEVANRKPSYYTFYGEYKPPAYDPKLRKLRNPDVDPIKEWDEKELDNRSRLIIRSDTQTITTKKSGKQQADLSGKFYGSQETPIDVHLGNIKFGSEGQLIFVGGAGYSRTRTKTSGTFSLQPDIISEFDSIDWVDDTCDGSVSVTVTDRSRVFGVQVTSLYSAAILTAPPKFSWGIHAPTSLYDLIENIYAYPDASSKAKPWVDHQGSSFYEDIWPALYHAYSMSWVNRDALEGHGVRGKGNFLPLENQLKQKGNDQKVQELRDHIFERIRLPDYKQPGQASTRYMPRLSGNSGDAIDPGDALRPGEEAPPIRRFAALTALQYERFKKWKEGTFNEASAPWTPYKSLNQVPMNLQPRFLTRAALEQTNGEPLYPGIEMHWTARLPHLYQLGKHPEALDDDPPFRIDFSTVLPGHLGRGLSLPWQSDFDQCNTHWWPASRPDDVINIRDFTDQGFKGNVSETDFLGKIAPKMRSWTRGLRDTPDYPSEFFPGSTDMVRHWHNLGFVVKDSNLTIGQDKLPVWVETERAEIKVREVDQQLRF